MPVHRNTALSAARTVTQRAYVLQPVRSLPVRIGVRALVCIACVSAGAAAMRGYAGHAV